MNNAVVVTALLFDVFPNGLVSFMSRSFNGGLRPALGATCLSPAAVYQMQSALADVYRVFHAAALRCTMIELRNHAQLPVRML